MKKIGLTIMAATAQLDVEILKLTSDIGINKIKRKEDEKDDETVNRISEELVGTAGRIRPCLRAFRKRRFFDETIV